jgi:hypothetical protein
VRQQDIGEQDIGTLREYVRAVRKLPSYGATTFQVRDAVRVVVSYRVQATDVKSHAVLLIGVCEVCRYSRFHH